MKAPPYKAFATAAWILVSASASSTALASQAAQSADAAALRHLWSSYQQAVANKDAKELLSFYVNVNVPVMGGFAPASYALVIAANKQPVPRLLSATAKEDAAGESKLPPDQTGNLRVYSDGEIGSISFDYAAKVGHGHIIWSTVRTNGG
ncbi:hypothetical protein ISP15_11855 [Dyella jejuensis]|uniref:DUF4019 domain-containing protein n=1 Tax=Dyella jejuensis TaxID=1432009 RepID=A0ABW8JIX2_9GAMM